MLTTYRDDSEWTLRVAKSGRDEGRVGDVVVAVPTGPRRRSRAAPRSVRVVEVLGPPGTPEADFRAVAWRRRLPIEFPDDVLEAADGVSSGIDQSEIGRRLDLRDRDFFTIDPPTARDHDDALAIEPTTAGGVRLWVAIADVAHFVAEGTPLDAEARSRGNSVYFPDRALPMLPEALSAGVCSLVPDVDRLAVVAELAVDGEGRVTQRRFHRAVIRSRARLDYATASRVMEGEGAAPGGDERVSAALVALGRLARKAMRRRFDAGSIDFDLPEPEVVLDDEGRVIDIVAAPRTLAHRAVEESMLLANRAVAEVLTGAGVPAIFRNHAPPGMGDVDDLRRSLAALGLSDAAAVGVLDLHEITRAVARAEGGPLERIVHRLILRAMSQARYEVECRGHFALAFDHYLHFTSPIRRYADLVAHRALVQTMNGTERAAPAPRALGNLAAHLCVRERVAVEAEREMIDLAKCGVMAERLGEEFDGVVTGVARHGLYVSLDPLFVEGLVHVSTLPEFVDLDVHGIALVARRSGQRFVLGDPLRVRLDAVDRIRDYINCSIVSRGRKKVF